MHRLMSVIAFEPQPVSFRHRAILWREFGLLPLHQAVQPSRLRRSETHVVPGSLFAALTTEPAGIRFAGEIDINNSFAFAQLMQSALRGGSWVHVDLSLVRFRDPDGIRIVMKAARKLSSGRKILLHGLPPSLIEVMRATGWIQGAGLAICDCLRRAQVSESIA